MVRSKRQASILWSTWGGRTSILGNTEMVFTCPSSPLIIEVPDLHPFSSHHRHLGGSRDSSSGIPDRLTTGASRTWPLISRQETKDPGLADGQPALACDVSESKGGLCAFGILASRSLSIRSPREVNKAEIAQHQRKPVTKTGGSQSSFRFIFIGEVLFNSTHEAGRPVERKGVSRLALDVPERSLKVR
ncbi:hypothetical protein ElyMa_005568000 [Elysia marginata]|uniref:Uncharacterized protein n=1 Tax=Elysia marginata TaxID=1093978 RepID=A0AAV4F0C4_9GAST|nr:hypothetical protein ElyMa_005568000 [Elysia marginata]